MRIWYTVFFILVFFFLPATYLNITFEIVPLAMRLARFSSTLGSEMAALLLIKVIFFPFLLSSPLTNYSLVSWNKSQNKPREEIKLFKKFKNPKIVDCIYIGILCSPFFRFHTNQKLYLTKMRRDI